MIVVNDLVPGSTWAVEETDELVYLCLSVQPMGDHIRIGWVITGHDSLSIPSVKGYFKLDEWTYLRTFDDGRYVIRTNLVLVNKGEE